MRRRVEQTAIALLVAAAAYAAYQLQVLRFGAGDVYPAYSSLRTDPLGAKLLHDALAVVPGLEVERLRDRTKTPELGSGDTVLFLGLEPSFGGPAEEPDELDAALVRGARIVLALAPGSLPPFRSVAADAPPPAEEGRKGRGQEDHERPPSFGLGWRGIELDFLPLPAGDGPLSRPETDVARRTPAAPASLPTQLAWRSGWVLAGLSPDWRVLYERSGQPVVAELAVGRGTVVVVTDAFHLSNEALVQAAGPRVASLLLGTPRRVLFDEMHLGLGEASGVMILARRYRLGGLFAGFALLAVLYVWSAALPFAGRRAEARPVPEAARGMAAALAALLARGLSDRRLLAGCWATFRRSHGSALPAGLAAEIEQVVVAAADPLLGYQSVRARLAERAPRLMTQLTHQAAALGRSRSTDPREGR